MKKVYEDEYKICFSDDIQVRCEYKNGGVTTSLKHDVSWHDTAKHIPKQNCIYCKNIQPERSKREDLSCSYCLGLEEACGNCFSEDGFCPKCNRLIRCGALNTMETS